MLWSTMILTAVVSGGSAAEHLAFDNGIEATVIHAADAPTQAFFTLIPLGLLDDEPGRAQCSHLVEHMLIRSTDRDSLFVDGIRLNGETGPAGMRLETMGPPEKWREALTRHARWLTADEFDPEVLEAEKGRVAEEERSTVQSAYTGKWAVAAWNQIVRYGQPEARVHGDVTAMTVDEVRDYVTRRVPIGAGIQIYAVGPVPADDVKAALEEDFAGLEPREAAPPGESPWDGSPVDLVAPWDLEAHHYLEWFELPDRGAIDRAAAMVLSQIITLRLQQARPIRNRGLLATATVDLYAPTGRYLVISAGLRRAEDADAMEQAISDILDDASAMPAGVPSLAGLIDQARRQYTEPPDFERLRRSIAGRPGAELLEAQCVLTQAHNRVAAGFERDDDFAAAFAKVTPARVKEVAEATLTEERRASLRLTPIE